jgi:hypothetical protein
VSNEDIGWHSLAIQYPGGIQTVKTITLDYFIKNNKINNIGLIKIDVEGAELDVLKGMQKTLDKLHPPVLIEFNNPRTKLAGHTLNELYDFITRYNYQAFRLKNNKLVKMKTFEIERIYNENLLFLYE